MKRPARTGPKSVQASPYLSRGGAPRWPKGDGRRHQRRGERTENFSGENNLKGDGIPFPHRTVNERGYF